MLNLYLNKDACKTLLRQYNVQFSQRSRAVRQLAAPVKQPIIQICLNSIQSYFPSQVQHTHYNAMLTHSVTEYIVIDITVVNFTVVNLLFSNF